MSVLGSLFGLAYGDAMGAPTEFGSYKVINRAYRKGLLNDLPKKARVTDDTQMAMAVARALVETAESTYVTPDSMTEALTAAFIEWYVSPDNTADRAPGGACLSACSKMRLGISWQQAAKFDAKGCGANMRVTPIGLANWLDSRTRSGIAQLQAAMTHWHPTALAASDVTQQATWLLNNGCEPGDLLKELLVYVHTAMEWDNRPWIGEIVDNDGRVFNRTQHDLWMVKGWAEVKNRLLAVKAEHRRGANPNVDPCAVGGAGWCAEEALATALHCFLLFPTNGNKVVARAAATSGDSDSIAALAGAFAGAANGLETFPSNWHHRIEYSTELGDLVERLV